MKQQVDKGNKYKGGTNRNVGKSQEIIMASQPTWCWENNLFAPTETVGIVVVQKFDWNYIFSF